jgi:hypothetical protein
MSPVQQGSQFAVSPHGIHVATIAQMVTQDGVHPIAFSPNVELKRDPDELRGLWRDGWWRRWLG